MMRFGIVASSKDITQYLNDIKYIFKIVEDIKPGSVVVVMDSLSELMDMWRSVNCPIVLFRARNNCGINAPYIIEIRDDYRG
jgi:hypothetical protein